MNRYKWASGKKPKYAFHYCTKINKLCQKSKHWAKGGRLSSCITSSTAIFIPELQDSNQY